VTKTIFTSFNLIGFLKKGWWNMGLDNKDLLVLAVSVLVLLCVSIAQTKFHVREKISGLPLPIRWGIYLVGIVSIAIFGIYGPGYSEAQFIYMQF